MPLVRPLSALGPHIMSLADTAQAANVRVVKEATFGLKAVVGAHGAAHHIKGRNGKPVALMAKADVLLFGGTPVGQVKGVPEGFWSIVEHGSGPHRIAKRKKRGSKMLSTPHGYFQAVNHPGHGPQGHPWAESMVEGEPIVQRILAVEQTRALIKQWN